MIGNLWRDPGVWFLGVGKLVLVSGTQKTYVLEKRNAFELDFCENSGGKNVSGKSTKKIPTKIRWRNKTTLYLHVMHTWKVLWVECGRSGRAKLRMMES